MKSVSKFFKIFCLCCTALAVLIFSAVACATAAIDNEYKLVADTDLNIDCVVPIKAVGYSGVKVDGKSSSLVGAKYNVKLKIFGIIPVKNTSVEIVDDMYVSVLGVPFGMKIYTDGVLIIDISDIDTVNGYVKPAKNAGLKVGDFIISINGQKVYSNEDVAELIENSNGKDMHFIIKRENVIKNFVLKPELSKSTGIYKAGIWVRDSSAGIGTLTFYCPKTNIVCGLGHSVNDSDTGKILTISSGEMVSAEIVSLSVGKKGSPGELHGRFTNTKLADFVLNCSSGVYGKCSNVALNGTLMPVALKQEVKNGTAYILSTIEGGQPQKFSCKISIIKSNAKTQNLLVEITDKELLSVTGGIIQGMSGSPIIQNGKLVGAVTHVLIDEPSKGYGIFAENMLETAQSLYENNKSKEAS